MTFRKKKTKKGLRKKTHLQIHEQIKKKIKHTGVERIKAREEHLKSASFSTNCYSDTVCTHLGLLRPQKDDKQRPLKCCKTLQDS